MSLFGLFSKPTPEPQIVTQWKEKELTDDDMTDELLERWAGANDFLVYREPNRITLIHRTTSKSDETGAYW